MLDLSADPVDQPTNLGLNSSRYRIVRAVANATLQKFNEGDEFGAYEEAACLTDVDERLALWSILRPHPACRRALRRMHDEEIAAQQRLP